MGATHVQSVRVGGNVITIPASDPVSTGHFRTSAQIVSSYLRRNGINQSNTSDALLEQLINIDGDKKIEVQAQLAPGFDENVLADMLPLIAKNDGQVVQCDLEKKSAVLKLSAFDVVDLLQARLVSYFDYKPSA